MDLFSGVELEAGSWSCHVCTFINDSPDATACVICNTARPAATTSGISASTTPPVSSSMASSPDPFTNTLAPTTMDDSLWTVDPFEMDSPAWIAETSDDRPLSDDRPPWDRDPNAAAVSATAATIPSLDPVTSSSSSVSSSSSSNPTLSSSLPTFPDIFDDMFSTPFTSDTKPTSAAARSTARERRGESDAVRTEDRVSRSVSSDNKSASFRLWNDLDIFGTATTPSIIATDPNLPGNRLSRSSSATSTSTSPKEAEVNRKNNEDPKQDTSTPNTESTTAATATANANVADDATDANKETITNTENVRVDQYQRLHAESQALIRNAVAVEEFHKNLVVGCECDVFLPIMKRWVEGRVVRIVQPSTAKSSNPSKRMVVVRARQNGSHSQNRLALTDVPEDPSKAKDIPTDSSVNTDSSSSPASIAKAATESVDPAATPSTADSTAASIPSSTTDPVSVAVPSVESVDDVGTVPTVQDCLRKPNTFVRDWRSQLRRGMAVQVGSGGSRLSFNVVVAIVGADMFASVPSATLFMSAASAFMTQVSTGAVLLLLSLPFSVHHFSFLFNSRRCCGYGPHLCFSNRLDATKYRRLRPMLHELLQCSRLRRLDVSP